MTSASATRRIPFWILTLGSAGLTGYGIWSATNRLKTMEAVLLDGSATTSDVYAGQSWIAVDTALIIGGLVGLALTLAVWAVGTRVGARAVADEAAILAPATEDVTVVEEAVVVAPEADAPLHAQAPVDTATDSAAPTTR